jgi:hypothetical protein
MHEMAPDNLEEDEAAHFLAPTLRWGRVYFTFAAIGTIAQPNSTHDDNTFFVLVYAVQWLISAS